MRPSMMLSPTPGDADKPIQKKPRAALVQAETRVQGKVAGLAYLVFTNCVTAFSVSVCWKLRIHDLFLRIIGPCVFIFGPSTDFYC